ncbi:MAG: MaoC/PaaZ C-terminal domain-containing protein, partial [Arthrobacter sp.]
MSATVVTFEELPSLVGRDLGYTDYIEITQDQVNTFADATDDHQWIHTDPEKAK